MWSHEYCSLPCLVLQVNFKCNFRLLPLKSYTLKFLRSIYLTTKNALEFCVVVYKRYGPKLFRRATAHFCKGLHTLESRNYKYPKIPIRFAKYVGLKSHFPRKCVYLFCKNMSAFKKEE